MNPGNENDRKLLLFFEILIVIILSLLHYLSSKLKTSPDKSIPVTYSKSMGLSLLAFTSFFNCWKDVTIENLDFNNLAWPYIFAVTTMFFASSFY